MTTEIPNDDIVLQDLGAYFDDELSPERAQSVGAALEADEKLRTEHLELGALRGVVRAALEAEAKAIPAARFEQIWDEIDRAIERDARLQAGADRNVSIWTRLWTALRPLRMPAVIAAGAAAIAVIVVRPSSEGPNNPEGIASVAPSPRPEVGQSDAPPKAEQKRVVQVPLAMEPDGTDHSIAPMPVPENNEVEIHGIEFGAGSGSISSNGTVTVLYVEEDEEPTISERSL
ncbi:anti-sigma factor family protein [Paraliomyxa miuraensis]|uniref:anti-sigma factor family protein n=1 Tax=Paraliomyxa miuraensis TaxID=376150 RepID=UPI0022565AE9|nr:hypothetical protein [Paraliomyxa miuraensis]MCX4245936.1 hypothetical protein [Paraliomyxa miuraensis]